MVVENVTQLLVSFDFWTKSFCNFCPIPSGLEKSIATRSACSYSLLLRITLVAFKYLLMDDSREGTGKRGNEACFIRVRESLINGNG